MEPISGKATDISPVDEPGDDGAPDIVGRTGEEMPLAMHDQGHRPLGETTPEQAFDPRLPERET